MKRKKSCCKLMVAELISWALVVQIGKITFRFFFFFHFPHNFSWKARFSTESKKERKKKDRGRRPYYLLTYNSTSNDSDSFKKQQKVC